MENDLFKSKSNIRLTKWDKDSDTLYFTAFDKEYSFKFDNTTFILYLIAYGTGEVYEYKYNNSINIKDIIFGPIDYGNCSVDELNKIITLKLFFTDDYYTIETMIDNEVLKNKEYFTLSFGNSIEIKLIKNKEKSLLSSQITFHGNYLSVLTGFQYSNHLISLSKELSDLCHIEIESEVCNIKKQINSVLSVDSPIFLDKITEPLNAYVDEKTIQYDTTYDKNSRFKEYNIKDITHEISSLEEDLKIMKDELNSLNTFINLLENSHIINNTHKLKLLFAQVDILSHMKSIKKIYSSVKDGIQISNILSKCNSKSPLVVLIEVSDNEVYFIYTNCINSDEIEPSRYDADMRVYLIDNKTAKKINCKGYLSIEKDSHIIFGNDKNDFLIKIEPNQKVILKRKQNSEALLYKTLECFSVIMLQ